MQEPVNISKAYIYYVLGWAYDIKTKVSEANDKNLTKAYNRLRRVAEALRRDISETDGEAIYEDTLKSLGANVQIVTCLAKALGIKV